jgi:hypothetical protein
MLVQDLPPPPIVSFGFLPASWHKLPEGGSGALSWRYRPDSYGWVGSMPRGGIAVWVVFPKVSASGYKPLSLQLPKKPTTTLEGAPDAAEYRIVGRVRGRAVEVHVDIRQKHPSKAQWSLAQRVVSAMRFR